MFTQQRLGLMGLLFRTAADDIPYFFKKIRLGISCESSDVQMIHIKCQTFFSWKSKTKRNVVPSICNGTLKLANRANFDIMKITGAWL